MTRIWEQLQFLRPNFGDLLEILIVATLLYRLLLLIQRTRAMQMLLGLDSRSRAAERLVRAAIDSGTRDNVTVVIADVVDAPAVVGTGIVLGAGVDLAHVVDPTAVRPLRSA